MKKTRRWERIKILSLVIALLLLPSMMFALPNSGEKVTLNLESATFKEFFDALRQQTGLSFVYNTEQTESLKPITVHVKDETVDNVLRLVLKGTGLNYSIEKDIVIISKAEQQGDTPSAPKKITGTVVDDATGETLPFVTIMVKGTTNGTITSDDGTFSLTVPSGESILAFSYLGYEKLERIAPAKGNNMYVRLKPSSTALEGVVVTGYQTLSRERVTGAFGKVSQEVLKQRLEPGISSKLEGAIPGVFINPDGTIASIRGVSSLNADTAPLYVVDGFPVEDINQINPNDIESITVLKDASAASIYGVRGSNGVIVVATRKGAQGRVAVDLNTSFFITPVPNYDNHNLMNSSQLVDYQQEMFDLGMTAGGLNFHNGDTRYANSLAVEAMLAHQNGSITESQMNTELNRLRSLNNADQVRDLLLRPRMEQHHGVSMRGGYDKARFYGSVDYRRSNSNELNNHNDAVNINLKTEVDLAKWLTVDANLFTNFSSSESDPGVSGMSYLGYGSMTTLPYNMLKDENGELIPAYRQKSQSEIDRLVALGLYDETSNPLSEMGRAYRRNSYTLIRAQAGVTFKLMEGLNLKLGYQTERDNTYTKTVLNADSYSIRHDVNDATVGTTRMRPEGADLKELRANQNNWTARAQLNFDRTFGEKHAVTAIAGTEWRAENLYITNTHRMGYDDRTLLYESFNVTQLAQLTGTQSLANGIYSYSERQNNNFGEVSHRYISFYGNVAYTYNNKYSLTFSARYDDADMLGGKSQIPMWSVGGKWNMASEKFMQNVSWLNLLDFRMTYGLTGNVDRSTSPYLQIVPQENLGMGGIVGARISALANKSLRWERTDVFNVGFDFATLGNRLNGSIEFYNRKSTDLLAMREVDPSIGAPNNNMVLMNFGSLYNRGVELGLNSVNIKTKDFSWQTMFNFSYNKNKVTRIDQGVETLYSNTSNNGIYKEGDPMSALYSFRYAGLNEDDGSIMVYDQNGQVIKSPGGVTNLSDSIGHLEYSGTKVPKWTIGFTNTFTYKQFSLAIQIIANGGHVMRDVLPNVGVNAISFEQNMDRRAMNFWRKPGDEATAVMPAPIFTNVDPLYNIMWTSNSNNVLKADYIRVRNITLGYDIPNNLFGKHLFSSARATFQVSNPFLWVRNSQGLNPEIVYSQGSEMARLGTPVMPTYMIGLNVTF